MWLFMELYEIFKYSEKIKNVRWLAVMLFHKHYFS